jgi:phosphopantothenate---cysteine ligase (CTP)
MGSGFLGRQGWEAALLESVKELIRVSFATLLAQPRASVLCFVLMRCIVTAGPSYEPLDEVRRLTNFSTGRLGAELAGFLYDRGHEVTLLMGQQASYRGPRRAQQIEMFGASAELREQLQKRSGQPFDAVFHAAAVSDFAFGKVWRRTGGDALVEVRSGKLSSHCGSLLAELAPTPKIISDLRTWFPTAKLTGWKYEVEDDAAAAMALGQRQITDCHTDACVVNGPAYGAGFGLVRASGERMHLADTAALFQELEALASEAAR